jgi:hypothetical protein
MEHLWFIIGASIITLMLTTLCMIVFVAAVKFFGG